MAEKLTPQQLQAVTNRGGKLLVSAAAGSGKTKVLVDRLLSYLTDPIHPANIDEFLIITYTKAAASELRGKIAAKLSERIAQEPDNRHLQRQLQRLYMTNISTVHAFCGEILRQFAHHLELSADFRVADESECSLLQESAMEQILEEAYQTTQDNALFCAFMDTQGIGRDDRKAPEILLRVFQSAQCHLDPEGWLERCIETSDPQDCTDAAQTVWGQYLIEDFFEYLDLQIEAMEHSATLASQSDGLENVSKKLWDTVYQLRHLRESKTWDEIVARRSLDYGVLRFPKKINDPDLVDGIKVVRNSCKKGIERYLRGFADTSESILSDLRRSSDAVRGMIQLVRKFKSVYDELKRKRRILDFSDLEHYTLRLLLGKKRSEPTAIAKEIGRRFIEVMVDEYQDSNEVQDAIYSALTSERENCFMVGDVKQSIYQFRLADPGIFLEKYSSYVSATDAVAGQGRKVILSKNFRSAGPVLEAVNSVFKECMTPEVGGLYYGEEEALHEGIPHAPLCDPEIEFYAIDVQEDTYAEEADWTAQRIAELLDGNHFIRSQNGQRPIEPEDIVILLRSPGSVGDEFREALEKRGIRCSMGGGSDLLEAPEIIVLRSLLQTVYNPQLDIPLVAALASPLFCFSADDLAICRSVHRNRTVYQSLLQDASPKSAEFLRQLSYFRNEARTKSLSQLLETIFVTTRIDNIYGAMNDGELRRDNLQSFYQLAVEFESGGQRDLGRFLEYLERMEDKGLLVTKEPSNAGCVTLMSIHKSKGLEFPVVFLCALGRSFNKESQRAQVLCDKELGLGVLAVDTVRRVRYPTLSKKAISVKVGRDSLSEELRVLYVAMTRAKDRLIMTYASNRLEAELTEMISRLNMNSKAILIREAVCPGDWVLMAALKRTESGELFRRGGCINTTESVGKPWLVRVVEGNVSDAALPHAETQTSVSDEVLAQIRHGLSMHYSHLEATKAPSKQTATQRKGRIKDQEAAENAKDDPIVFRTWRKPTFVERSIDAASYGTAVHSVLQHVDLRSACDETAILQEVERLRACEILTSEQASQIDCKKLAALFSTSIGRKICESENVLREFKFSILDDGSAFSEELAGEKILLQGVIDCAIIEDDGVTVIDFKTDRIKPEKLEEAAKKYRPQIEAYTEAIQRIFNLKVKYACLYFVEQNQFVGIV